MENEVTNVETSEPTAIPGPSTGALRVTSVFDRAVIQVLATSHRRKLDVGAMLTCLAAEFPGGRGAQLAQLSKKLSQGTPVVDALAQTNVLDRSVTLALQLAQQNDRLLETYDALLRVDGAVGHNSDGQWQELGSEFVRTLLSFVVAWFMVSFLLVFIVPTFESIFDEFGLNLPYLFQALVSLRDYLSIAFLIGLLVLLIYVIFRSTLFLRAFSHRIQPGTWGKQLLPNAVNVRSLLAVAIQSPAPAIEGLSTLADQHHHPRIRRRLLKACEQIERGADPWKSLANVRLITPREANALCSAKSNQMRAWLLSWSADSYRGRRSIGTILLTKLTSLVSTLLLGIVVAWTAISVFLVLAGLISGLT